MAGRNRFKTTGASATSGLRRVYADTMPEEADVANCRCHHGGRVRVGTDVQEVAPVEESLHKLGQRYVKHLFTPHEAHSVGLPEASAAEAAPGLAARFAAKEAVIKVLRADGKVPWLDIRIIRLPHGPTELQLTGTAARLAGTQALTRWTLSFSHDGAFAVATVIAIEGGIFLGVPSSSGRSETGGEHQWKK